VRRLDGASVARKPAAWEFVAARRRTRRADAAADRKRRLIFRPDTTPPGDPPADIAGAVAVTTTSPDGLALRGWFLPPPDAARFVVLYLHGNGGNIGNRANRLRQVARLGWGALLVGYRGYGGNPGSPSEAGLLSDSRAGLAALAARGIAPERIVLWGESLGTGLAVQLAAGTRFAAVVLEAPYTSLTDIARARYPGVPVRLLLRDRFDSLARIGRVTSPLIVLAGERDRIVPQALSRRLFAQAREPKQLRLQPAAGHEELGTTEAFDAVRRFVEAHTAETALSRMPA
jgi:fermentation-respiration switch protein FrsA (DUF1100 family)